MTILSQIVSDKRQELERNRHLLPMAELKGIAGEQPRALNFGGSIQGDGIRLIAEIKKASPSRGTIRTDFDPVRIAGIYASNGAAAISVVTETNYFQGSLSYLKSVRNARGNHTIPLLRKDFIFDPYQVYETRACGADALLLIAAILNPDELSELITLSHALGMTCLVEVHDEHEAEIALKNGAGIVGINNRDLKTFKVDLSVTERIRPLIPDNRIVVSESGIKGRSDIERLKRAGVQAVLVGEYLLSASDIAGSMRGAPVTRIKMCGFTGMEQAVFAAKSGADFIGLVFAQSKRQISLETGRMISWSIHSLENETKVAGVFVNEEFICVNNISDYCDLDWVQLSGDESMEYCSKIRRPILKVIHVTGKNAGELIHEMAKAQKLSPNHELVYLLDSKTDDSFGGTGQCFDWEIAREVSAMFPVIIAGGLTPENVGDLVKLVKPWGVDVSSGIEENGMKSEKKIIEFIKAVKLAEGGH